jgi:uncharacterized protein (TIGR02118 family)
MVKLTVLFPNQSGARFDEGYYFTAHMEIVRKLVGPVLAGAGVDRGIDTPDGPAPYRFISYMCFESAEVMQAAMDAHKPALMADVPNYTDIEPILQVSDVVIAQHARAA